MNIVDEIINKYKTNNKLYIGEKVTISSHMIQTAMLAEKDNSPKSLVCSCLLHDYGHFIIDNPDLLVSKLLDGNHEYLAFKFLSKVSVLKDKHSKFNIEYLRTLILLEKFELAFDFSRKVWLENELFFEADLLLGIDSLIKKDYQKAENYFKRLNGISRYNLFFRDFVGNILISLTKASQNNEKESFEFLNRVPDQFKHITKIQKTFLYCHFDSEKTIPSFYKLVENKDYNFE